MKRRLARFAAVVLAVGCGAGPDSSAGPDSGGPPNAIPVVVDTGPAGTTRAANVPFISVTVCVPGTTNCQTIDHVAVDTGSSGLRVLASELSGDLSLPPKAAPAGGALTECFEFATGFTWGSVRMADVRIGGEVAAGIPIQLIGDPASPSVPSACSDTGQNQGTLAAFGAKGLVGLNPLIADCGSTCADPQLNDPPTYYDCNAGSCTGITLSETEQVSNPLASFEQDNNGVVIVLPQVPASGAATASGTLVFGIGTAANNALGGATVLTLDDSAFFTTSYNGQTLPLSLIDSGTTVLGFDDASIAACTSSATGYYCPSSPLTLTAQNIGRNGNISTVTFAVESAETLFANQSFAAFDDIAGPYPVSSDTFDWGLPFFFGRSVFFALDKAPTPGGTGPYVAY